jgi:SAM-dependent methyltransferase
MHKNVRLFCEKIKRNLPVYFSGVRVLDCGCLDINGNNRYLFESSVYTGIDIVDGPNVDVITRVHEFTSPIPYDVVISTEMLEHDSNFEKSLQNMFHLTRSEGLLLFTAAGTDRPEHGTSQHHPKDSPLTHDYYRNITVKMIADALDLEWFSWFEISYSKTDIRFAGIKR